MNRSIFSQNTNLHKQNQHAISIRSVKKLMCLKTVILLLGSLFLVGKVNSQTKYRPTEPKGSFVFIPHGTYVMKHGSGADSTKSTIKLDAFWISCEITNAEYREFLNYAKSNSQEEICLPKYEKKKTRTQKDSISKSFTCVKYEDILLHLIDSTAMDRSNADYKNYFTDKKYDQYPVVGVPKQAAEYYCAWKTARVNEGLLKKKLPATHDYRLPSEGEWLYAANSPINAKKADNLHLQSVDKGAANNFGLYHLENNVSEWVINNSNGKAVVCGGSWKTPTSTSERLEVDPKSKESYIGFRVAITALP